MSSYVCVVRLSLLCLLATGAQPNSDLNDTKLLAGDTDLKRELAETDAPEARCRVAAEALRVLGVSGEGDDPCEWQDIECSEECEVKSLELANRDVKGELSGFANFTSLAWLDLRGTAVTGDLSSLSKLTRIGALDLSGTAVMGDPSSLSNLTSLWRLDLLNTAVMGDLSSLSKLTSLQGLYLQGTAVTGDLSSLSNLTSLKWLYLRGTAVMGDLSSLSGLKFLLWLDLSGTKVAGDVTELRDLPRLYVISLASTAVHGDLGFLRGLPILRKADLSETQVTGWFTSEWGGCCQNLQELHLGASHVGREDMKFMKNCSHQLLPSLNFLNVSGAPLNISVDQFMASLAVIPMPRLLASKCKLSGVVKSVREAVTATATWSACSCNTGGRYVDVCRLRGALQVLDVSGNNLHELHQIPSAVRIDVGGNQKPLKVNPEVLRQAARDGVDVWLTGTEVANRKEIGKLLQDGVLTLEERLVPCQGVCGHHCHDIVNPSFRVSPDKFLPDAMCSCRPGYAGRATDCTACGENMYSMESDAPKCKQCPVNSTSSTRASGNVKNCQCSYGTVEKNGTEWRCQCPKNEALSTKHWRCIPCGDHHFLCPESGSIASSAQVQHGYARLEPFAETVYKCLEMKRCIPSGCAVGYTGPLCSNCAPKYRRSGMECTKCPEKDISMKHGVALCLAAVGSLVVVGVAAWRAKQWWSSLQLDLCWQCALDLLFTQVFVLLHLVQLWTVLGRLAQVPEGGLEMGHVEEERQGDGLQSFLAALQFTSAELQSFFALQCRYDGQLVRTTFAVATPLVPLGLLLICGCLECFWKGFGIQVGLKLLTLLFVGGASGSAQLLSCQRFDGTGSVRLDDSLAFRPLFPQWLCSEETWVDAIGWFCFTCYGFVIPLLLAFLFAKQHVVMRKSKTFAAQAQVPVDELQNTLKLQPFQGSESFQESVMKKRLVAAAAAYVAVHVKGRARVERKDDKVIITPMKRQASLDVEVELACLDREVHLAMDREVRLARTDREVESARIDGEEEFMFTVDSLVTPYSESKEVSLQRAEVLRRHWMVQMLTERSILDEIEAERSDRTMLGAKQLLCRYVSCQYVWMEVCMRLASTALVSVVSSQDGLWLSVAITLGMALLIGIAQPFAQPQVNTLQASCFACLALAAVGFGSERRWLSRVALAPPLVLLGLLLRRPDSCESLALRLQQELEKKLDDGPVEVSAEQVKFR